MRPGGPAAAVPSRRRAVRLLAGHEADRPRARGRPRVPRPPGRPAAEGRGMSTHRLHFRDAAQDVVTWRTQRLRRAGFAPDTAAALAADFQMDLHALLELVERGCPPHLAARILAPLDA